MLSLIRQFGHHLTQRLIALAVLAGVCLALVPLPIAAPPVAGKDRSKPFPCMDRPCGCASADQCWKGCCCFTNSEKVAWARANRIELPAFVLAAAKKEAEAVAAAKPAPQKPAAGCCQSHGKSCCEKEGGECSHSHAVAANDADRKTAPTVRDDQAQSHDERTDVRWTLGIAAQKCRGEHGTIAGLPVCIPVAPDVLTAPPTLAIRLSIPCSESFAGETLPPPVPPPRRVLCA